MMNDDDTSITGNDDDDNDDKDDDDDYKLTEYRIAGLIDYQITGLLNWLITDWLITQTVFSSRFVSVPYTRNKKLFTSHFLIFHFFFFRVF